MIGSCGASWQGVFRDVGDAIGRRNEIWVFIRDLVSVMLGDDGNERRLD